MPADETHRTVAGTSGILYMSVEDHPRAWGERPILFADAPEEVRRLHYLVYIILSFCETSAKVWHFSIESSNAIFLIRILVFF